MGKPAWLAGKTMRAALAPEYGSPSVIALSSSVAIPTPKADQLLIKVHSTTVNPADCKQRSGNLKLVLSHQFPVAFGQDFAGVVESAPPTSRFKSGDQVYGCTAPRNGCSADYIAVYERECAAKPLSLSWAQAAATPTAACTAYRGVVTLGKATEGMRVLVHGASGGVGSAMVQIAKALGCSVWATCSPRNHEYVERLGVVALFDYNVPLAAALAAAPQTPADVRFELVLDAVCADIPWPSFAFPGLHLASVSPSVSLPCSR